MRRILSEPLLQFFLLGLVLVVVVLGRPEDSTDHYRIVFTDSDVQDLERKYVAQHGVLPTPRQLELLTAEAIRREILYREGLALKLGEGDEIVRRRIVQKAGFLLQDLIVPPVPTDEELADWYEVRADAYADPPRASFTHVFFSPDRNGADDAIARARRTLPELLRDSRARAPELGDRFPDLYDYSAMSPSAVARVFGDSPVSEAVFQVTAGVWAGPYESGLGWHLIRVSSRSEASARPLAEVIDRVRDDWEASRREAANEAAFAELRSRYRVVREDAP